MHEKASFKISCFGAGFVGIPTSSVLALYNPHLQVPLSIYHSSLSMTLALLELNNVS